MKCLASVLLLTSLLLPGCAKKEEPKVKISVPGVNISVGEDGKTSVEAPGISVKTDKRGAEIKTPAGETKVKN